MKRFEDMDHLPDKFEFDLYLKTFLLKIIERKKAQTSETVSSKSKYQNSLFFLRECASGISCLIS
jgi:hypothetical protein